MKTARTYRSIKNFFAGILGYSISTSVMLFTTPLLIEWLGDERYGAFRTANNWTNYIGLLELGIGGSLLAVLAKSLGQDNKEIIRLTLLTGIKVYLKIVLVMFIVGIGLGWFISDLVQVKGALASELQTGYWIGLISVFLLPLSPFRMLADANQRSYFIHALLTFQVVFIASLSLLLARIGWGISGQYMALLIGCLPYQIMICWDAWHRYPNIFAPVADQQVTAKIEKQIWQLNWPTFILNLSGQLSFFTDNIIISFILGPAIVVPFFVTQRLPALAQSQIQGIGNATWAALADLNTRGEQEKFNARLIELTQLITVIGIAFMVAIAAYNPYFVNLWVGKDHFGGSWVNLLAACNGFLQGLLSLWGWCFSGTGNVAKLVKPAIIATSVNLIVSIVGTHLFGICGPLLGTFVAFLTISSWWLPLLLHKVFGISLKQLFFAIAKPLMFGIPYGVTVWWIVKSHTPWGWLGLAAEMGLTAFFYLVMAWLLVFDKIERSAWRSRLRISF